MPTQQQRNNDNLGYVSLWANKNRTKDTDTAAYGSVKLKVAEVIAMLQEAQANGEELLTLNVSVWANDNKQGFANPATYTGKVKPYIPKNKDGQAPVKSPNAAATKLL